MAIEVQAPQLAPPSGDGWQVHEFTVEEYYRLGELGILGPETRTELLDGVIYEMSPVGPPHAWGTDDLARWFFEHIGRRAHIGVQRPASLSDKSEPLPDLVLLKPGNYRKRHPLPDEVLLIVEVTDTTVAHDLQRKALRYAQAEINEYWVWLLRSSELVVHRNPSPDGYRSIQRLKPGEPVSLLAFPDVSFDLAELNPTEG